MTYNIRHGLGNDGTVDLRRIASIIRESDAEIIALQEVDRFWKRSHGADQVAELSRLQEMDSRFGANLSATSEAESGTQAAEYGTMILSRFEIVEHNNTLFPDHLGFEPRGLLEVRIRHPSITPLITVFNTHLQVGEGDTEDLARSQRREQATIIAERVRGSDGPVVLMGDFNAESGSSELAPLADALQDAWQVIGSGSDGKTIPTDQELPPSQRIDVIFTNRMFRCTNCTVLANQQTRVASDHYPVIADLELAG